MSKHAKSLSTISTSTVKNVLGFSASSTYKPAYKAPTSMTAFPSFAPKCVKTPVPVEVLIDILRYYRFAGTEGEMEMINKHLMVLPGAYMDDYGNVIVDRRSAPEHRTMFSSHTDSVDKKTAQGRKQLATKQGWLNVKGGGVLGADCGTGVWIMLNLLKACTPGLYVFHREEEIGGGGSRFISDKTPELVEGIDHCIAFDRKDVSHIITHQGGERCCSQEFADSFAQHLNLGSGFTFSDNDGGSFTDSKNYTHLIPECTNLSVGYYDQHSQVECQDVSFVSRLVMKLINIDFSQLTVARDHTIIEDHWSDYNWNNYNSYGTVNRGSWKDDTLRSEPKIIDTFAWMSKIVEAFPAEIADILMEAGWTAPDLMDHLEDTYNCDPRDL